MACRSSSRPDPLAALTATIVWSPNCALIFSATWPQYAFKSPFSAQSLMTSDLLIATMIGIPFAASWLIHSFSAARSFWAEPSTTTMAISVLSITACVRSTLSFPSSPSSSNPAVSINTTGPIGCNSIALKTGSVVVPASGDTNAIS